MNPQLAPADLLHALSEHTDEARVLRALAAAVHSIGHGRAATIDAALGFAPGDVRRACRALRDRVLREAAGTLPADHTPWQRAGALAEMVVTSQHHRDACRRRGGDGQWRHGTVVGLLFEAERWHALPRTAMGMRNALRNSPSNLATKAHPPAAFAAKPAA